MANVIFVTIKTFITTCTIYHTLRIICYPKWHRLTQDLGKICLLEKTSKVFLSIIYLKKGTEYVF